MTHWPYIHWAWLFVSALLGYVGAALCGAASRD